MNPPTESGFYWVEWKGDRYIACLEGQPPFFQIELVDPLQKDQGNTPERFDFDPHDFDWVAPVVFPKEWDDEEEAPPEPGPENKFAPQIQDFKEGKASAELVHALVDRLMSIQCPKCGVAIGSEIKLNWPKKP